MPQVTALWETALNLDCRSSLAYTVAEAARYFKVSRHTLRRWTAQPARTLLSFFDLVAAVQSRAHFAFVESDERGMPIRLYPSCGGLDSVQRVIAVDPRIAFGRPIILRAGITTRAIAERVESGESRLEVAADYDLTAEEIYAALLFERERPASAKGIYRGL
jgi:uncharacterized protein (DUF433 family)